MGFNLRNSSRTGLAKKIPFDTFNQINSLLLFVVYKNKSKKIIIVVSEYTANS